jgi:polysaccharide biosynthesis protein PelG
VAGVGFELKKLFHEQGLLGNVKAYAYSSLTTIGPMALCMLMIIGMQQFMEHSGAPYLERELFLATVVYCFIFSVLLTGGLSMVLTRFIADMMFLKKYEHLMSSFYGSLAICLPVGALTSWLFLRNLPVGFGYKAATYLFFAELIVVWLCTVHLSALKDYKRIVRSFFIGVGLSVLGSWLLLQYTSFNGATGVLTMMDIGFLVIIILTMRHFEQKFPPKDSRIYLDFLAYFRKYPSLFFIGTFFYSGVYVHSFIYWLGPMNARVAENYVISPFYDLPVFYAYLTVVPSLVTFVVSVETSFYEKFRDYYSKILKDGTILDIARAKREMQRTLMQEISFLMEVQLLFTIVSIALGIKLLPALGFTAGQMDAFKLLTLGYFLFIIAFIVMLLMLYYDDRRGVLVISGLLVGMNAGFSYWSMHQGSHGLGMFLAALVTLAIALARLLFFVRNIDYYTFCTQPIVVMGKQPLWRRLRSRAPWKGWQGRKSGSAAMALAAVVLLAGCTDNEGAEASGAGTAAPGSAVTAASKEGLAEDKRLYERDDDTSIIPLYVTILPDKRQEVEGKPYTWYEMNRISSRMDESELKVILQEGAVDGSGPSSGRFGYGTTETNGKISLRGNTSRYQSQRSYKIKLNEQAGLWNDQRILNLSKHPFDPTRIRSKVSFDLFETIPNITSLRTQFVHLFVKDLSEGGPTEKPYEDYGLYTHAEQPNELFLKNHWLDPYGQLYKAVMFEFFRYPEAIKPQTDPSYDKAAFEKVLEIRGREEHEKLIQMLEDVNNVSIPIDEVMAKHFDLNNYLTWVASNIIMDNMDTNTQNFLLYSPLNSDKWYFLPWDYDGAWEQPRISNLSSDYSHGISNWWGAVLHNRFFRSDKNIRLLKDKIDELYGTINNDSVGQLVGKYRSVVEPFLKSAPDSGFLPAAAVKGLDKEFKRLAETPLRSLERFKQDLERPRPVYLGEVSKQTGGKLSFVWDASFDLQGDDLTYDWTLAHDPAMTRIIDQRKGITGTSVIEDSLPAGVYYWKIEVQDSHGNRQVAFDIYEDEDGIRHFGVRRIKVE